MVGNPQKKEGYKTPVRKKGSRHSERHDFDLYIGNPGRAQDYVGATYTLSLQKKKTKERRVKRTG